MNEVVESATRSRMGDLKGVLSDERFDRSARLLRLQGWRDDQLEAALATKTIANRLGPITCAVLAVGIVLTQSAILALGALALTIIGVFSPLHPSEQVYNWWARRAGWGELPPNRAAKRLGCVIGSLFFGGSAIALASGSTTTGVVLAGILAVIATFVAATNVCVPSIVFTLLWGSERGTARRLL